MAKMEPRLVRADDFIAESLEKRAAQMPQGEDADYMRKMAELFRNSGRTGMLRMWEEVPEEVPVKEPGYQKPKRAISLED